MRAARRIVAAVALVGLLAVPAAAAKDFRPGDVRLCGARGCVSVDAAATASALGRFIYADGRGTPAVAPRRGAAAYALRFRNGYTAGLVDASGRRFLSFGVICERFRRGVWYRVPAPLAEALREATEPLAPLRVPRRLPRSC